MNLRLLVSVSSLCRSPDLWSLKDDTNTIWCPGVTRENRDDELTRLLGGDSELQSHVRRVMDEAEKNGRLVYRVANQGDGGFGEQFSRILTILGTRLGRALPNWEGTEYYNASWNAPTMEAYFQKYAPEIQVCYQWSGRQTVRQVVRDGQGSVEGIPHGFAGFPRITRREQVT